MKSVHTFYSYFFSSYIHTSLLIFLCVYLVISIVYSNVLTALLYCSICVPANLFTFAGRSWLKLLHKKAEKWLPLFCYRFLLISFCLKEGNWLTYLFLFSLSATSLCFNEKNIYTQEVLAVVIQKLMEQTPLPTLLMRTVIQSLAMYPRLSGFVMNILQRLIVKQVWKQPKVWEGFVKCCEVRARLSNLW